MEQKKRTLRQSLRLVMTMVALLALALVASGCISSTSFNGGGYLRSANPTALNEKATFGINGKCQNGEFEFLDVETGLPKLVQGAGVYDGQFEYDDHAATLNRAEVRFHGDVSPDAVVPSALVVPGRTCEEVQQVIAGEGLSDGVVHFQGTYRPQDRALAKVHPECSKDPRTSTCTFTGTISDLGEPGVQAGDFFTIKVLSGPFQDYANAGPLEGGNFQVR